MARTRVKICGCASIADAEAAVSAGADAVGVILAASARRVELEDARAIARSVPPFVSVVAVFVDPTASEVEAARAFGCVPQFSGNESPEFVREAGAGRCVKAVHIERDEHDAAAVKERAGAFADADVLFDTRSPSAYGGTGVAFPWHLVEPLARHRRVIVSGGLTSENVAASVMAVRPFGVDVRSGVETNGSKDMQKMRAFVRAVRETDEQT